MDWHPALDTHCGVPLGTLRLWCSRNPTERRWFNDERKDKYLPVRHLKTRTDSGIQAADEIRAVVVTFLVALFAMLFAIHGRAGFVAACATIFASSGVPIFSPMGGRVPRAIVARSAYKPLGTSVLSLVLVAVDGFGWAYDPWIGITLVVFALLILIQFWSFAFLSIRVSNIACGVASAILGLGATVGAGLGWNFVLFGIFGLIASAAFCSRMSRDLVEAPR